MNATARPKALIVEDQPFVGMVTADVLRESGFEALHAYDGAEALGLLLENPEVHLLIAEAELPGEINGIELAWRVANERPDMQVVVAVGNGHSPREDLPRRARILQKPYASAELQTLVAGMSLLDLA